MGLISREFRFFYLYDSLQMHTKAVRIAWRLWIASAVRGPYHVLWIASSSQRIRIASSTLCERGLRLSVSPATSLNFTKTTIWHKAVAVRSHGPTQLGTGLRGGSAGQLSLKPTRKERYCTTAITGNMILIKLIFPKAKEFLWKLFAICARAFKNVH